MKHLKLPPLQRAQGEIRLPGSKSLSNRALLLAAQAAGSTRIRNLLDSDDTQRMREALQRLGVRLNRGVREDEWIVEGLGGPLGSRDDVGAPQAVELYLGNAGTAVRPLTAALCVAVGEFELKGDARMHERPIGDLTDALIPIVETSGGHIEFLVRPGYLPLRIRARGLRGGDVTVRGDVSSQFLTALLMAAPLTDEGMTIHVQGELVSKPYVRITLTALRSFGVEVGCDDAMSRFRVEPQKLRAPAEFLVEGDASSATYLLAAAAIAGGPVRVQGIGKASVQGDVAFIDVLKQMGATVDLGDEWIEVRRGAANRLRAVDLDLNHIPDAAMTVAALALFADGTTRIRNIWNWRVKETDRLSAVATELRKLGAAVGETRDSITITPPERMREAAIDTYDDHRMAMTFSLAAFGGVPVTINDPDCVAKTFPEYWRVLASLTGTVGEVTVS